MSQSSSLFSRAKQHIPGGVNSPVRAFKGVDGEPVFMQSARGAYLTDVDGKRYVDYVGSWGPMVVGHNHPHVAQAVKKAVDNGLSFGTPTASEVEMSELITRLMPNIEMVRMVNSGTEATMSAIRLARGFTQRQKILKFNGCYHGHSDSLLVNAGSGALTLGVPSSLGVPADLAQHTLTADFNDLSSVERLFELHGTDIAGIIVEPVAGNVNCVLPQPGFLQGLREICDRYQSVLILDEVMTGFRVALGGAQALYNVKADITTLGKVIGGGMPVGAFGGRRDIMQAIAPLGGVYQAGTLSGNPVAMAAGIAMLELVQAPNFFAELSAKTELLTRSLQELADAAKIPFTTNHVGGMFGIFFTTEKEIRTYQQVMTCDVPRFKKFFHGMLDLGVYLAPSAFEAGFISAAHTRNEIEFTLDCAAKVFATL